MKINHQVVVFDAAELAGESRFWAGVLGGTVDAQPRSLSDNSQHWPSGLMQVVARAVSAFQAGDLSASNVARWERCPL
jgi:hypothetical protein